MTITVFRPAALVPLLAVWPVHHQAAWLVPVAPAALIPNVHRVNTSSATSPHGRATCRTFNTNISLTSCTPSGDDSAFVELASNSETRATFVSNIIDFVVQHNLDGVDMDWEYPSTNDEAEDYTALMTELRAALDELSGDKFLTAAVIAQGDWNGQYIQSAVFDQVDFFNIMAYDEYQAINHSTLAYATTSIDYWENRGLSREKTVLGVPFYARPSWATYSSYVDADPANACTDSVGDNYYNGIPTIRIKSELANDRVCGMMMWELSQDTHDETSLLKAMWEVVAGQEPSYICD